MTGLELAMLLIKEYPHHEISVLGPLERGITQRLEVTEIEVIPNANIGKVVGEHHYVADTSGVKKDKANTKTLLAIRYNLKK